MSGIAQKSGDRGPEKWAVARDEYCSGHRWTARLALVSSVSRGWSCGSSMNGESESCIPIFLHLGHRRGQRPVPLIETTHCYRVGAQSVPPRSRPSPTRKQTKSPSVVIQSLPPRPSRLVVFQAASDQARTADVLLERKPMASRPHLLSTSIGVRNCCSFSGALSTPLCMG